MTGLWIKYIMFLSISLVIIIQVYNQSWQCVNKYAYNHNQFVAKPIHIEFNLSCYQIYIYTICSEPVSKIPILAS